MYCYWINIEGSGATSGSGPNRQEVLEDLARYYIFYSEIRDRTVESVEFAEYCDACNGNGYIAGKRYGSSKPCKACKGKGQISPTKEPGWNELNQAINLERIALKFARRETIFLPTTKHQGWWAGRIAFYRNNL